MKEQYNILRASVRQCVPKLSIVIFFSFFINLLMFVAPLHMLQMYDRVLVSRSETTLLVLTLLAIGLLVIYGVLEGVRSRILTRLGLKFDELMSSRILSIIFEVAVSRPSVRHPQQLLRDTDLIRDFIGGPAIVAFCDAPWVPVFIGVCFILHPMLGFVALIGALIVFALAAANELLTRKQLTNANRLSIKAANDSVISLRNSEIIKALGMISGIKNGWTKNRNKSMVHQLSASDRSGSILACSRFVRMGLQVTMLATGGYLAIQDQITPGTMIAASIIMGRALAPVEMAVSQWKSIIMIRNAYNRIDSIVDGYDAPRDVMDLPAPTGKIVLENIFIKAPEQSSGKRILNNISMEFLPGTITGIIGPSGCGKSSLARAILGVWPAEQGVVRYDGANINNWPSEDLGPYIGYMPQDIELFDGSVAQNIARLQDVNSEEVILAAKSAGVHELILQLSDGYDTNIGESGQALSGGQRQRIALARALYKSPKVIVLDEPNSNLDSAGEKALGEALLTIKKLGSTVIVISHRPSLLSNADNVAVLNNGTLLKFGPSEEIFRELGATKVVETPTNAS
jgi:PrtD family type I secretion system ABC transporter